jgi:UDP-N-acetylmuramate dehydrogenase
MDEPQRRIWQESVSLKDKTTFRIGGLTRYFVRVQSEEELLNALREAEQKSCPFFILGGGSNLLISDRGYSGVVIQMAVDSMEWNESEIRVGAGVSLNKLVIESIKRGLIGFEWGAIVPGTVGGAVYGNAGTPDQSIGHLTKEVRFLNKRTMEIESLSASECGFSYRDSIFCHDPEKIITSVILKKEIGNYDEISSNFREIIEKKVSSQPRLQASAGCVFKNPKGYSAGALIDQVGLKGRRIGDAQVSEKHANFIVNLGQAKSEEVAALIELIRESVYREFGLVLEEEIIRFPKRE